MSITIGEVKLLTATPKAWLEVAVRHVPELLSDHACCEKKAATMALNLMKHFYAYPDILSKLSKIAREELVHYEQVLQMHKKLKYRFKPKPACRYAKALWQEVDKSGPLALVDQLMICAIIEARSCERFAKLTPILPEPLSSYYDKLYQAEKRHATVYLDFARMLTEETKVMSRLNKLLQIEGNLVLMGESVFRFHSGVPTGCLVSEVGLISA